MRRDVLRFSGWARLLLLLSLALVVGCTRSKSSGPPESSDGEAAQEAGVQATGDSPQTTLSGDAAMNATATALVATATAEAIKTPQDIQATSTATVRPTDSPTLEPTKSPESTTVEPTPSLESTKAPTVTPSTSTGVSTHTVKAGENLFRIALEYGLTYQQLAAYNGIANPNFIVVGQVLKIPVSGTTASPPKVGVRSHMVKQGENLFRIALQYNMVYTVLAQANDLSYPYTIYPGQQLDIP